MLGCDCYSIVGGDAGGDAIINNLRDYISKKLNR